MRPLAAFTVLALAVVSLMCVTTCFDLQVAAPPCHHHAKTCAPLLLTAEAPLIAAAAVPSIAVISVVLLPSQATDFADFSYPNPAFSPPDVSPSAPSVLRI